MSQAEEGERTAAALREAEDERDRLRQDIEDARAALQSLQVHMFSQT